MRQVGPRKACYCLSLIHTEVMRTKLIIWVGGVKYGTRADVGIILLGDRTDFGTQSDMLPATMKQSTYD